MTQVPKWKYMKTFTTYTTGTLAGRDDGHPYTTRCFYDDIHSLAADHGTKPDEAYFAVLVSEVPPNFAEMIQEAQADNKRAKEEQQRERDRAELQRLKKKLGE